MARYVVRKQPFRHLTVFTQIYAIIGDNLSRWFKFLENKNAWAEVQICFETFFVGWALLGVR